MPVSLNQHIETIEIYDYDFMFIKMSEIGELWQRRCFFFSVNLVTTYRECGRHKIHFFYTFWKQWNARSLNYDSTNFQKYIPTTNYIFTNSTTS